MANSILMGDYGHAVVQVACLLDDRTAHLIFAAAELLPAEVAKPPPEPSVHLRVKQFGDRARVYFHRYVVSAAEAHAWYEQCRTGTVSLLAGDASWRLQCDQLFQEPQWPALILGSKFPFFGDIASSARTHHLFPSSMPAEIARLFELQPESRQWVSDRIFCSLARFPELVGSVHLIAPNPILRRVSHRLHVGDDGAEGSRIQLIARQGHIPAGLEITLKEHRPTGICAIHQTVATGPFVFIPHVARTEQVELIVRCPERGVLEWQEPTGFMRSATISGSLVGARKRVMVPGKDGAGSTPYEVSLVERGWTNTVGEAGPAGGIPARLRSSEFDRRRADDAARLGQKWFHGNRDEATVFIRGLIAGARERVWIVDPYFATTELFSFALATAYQDVEVVVLTSGSLALQKADEVVPAMEAGEALLRQLAGREDMKHVQVRVMTGIPTVHDRFLVIDEAVWFTGNSLNSIGERAGMMISLPEPSVVIEKLDAVMRDPVRTKDLSAWVSDRKANTAP